jgi:catalase
MSHHKNNNDQTKVNGDHKDRDLEAHREDPDGTYLTTSTGVRINHTHDSLKAGSRGPTIMEDFHFREKTDPLRP